MTDKPKAKNSLAENELDKAQEQFDAYDKNIKEMTLDRMNSAPKQEVEEQTKLSSSQIEKSKDLYLKPKRTIGPGVDPKTGKREVFNERFRDEYNFLKEYVLFIAENFEIIGETIDIWTKRFGGTNCEWWEVPVNVPVWGPRYLAEQLTKCSYHRLKMIDKSTSSDSKGNTFYGTMVADNTVQRLNARPVSTRKSIFMGDTSFASKAA
ncbi:MAG TPA: hypothetical protein VK590_11600 [Saprospiraceae bacterium]|nr:hypothetical protein [Saprospiraceae bacterium]